MNALNICGVMQLQNMLVYNVYRKINILIHTCTHIMVSTGHTHTQENHTANGIWKTFSPQTWQLSKIQFPAGHHAF